MGAMAAGRGGCDNVSSLRERPRDEEPLVKRILSVLFASALVLSACGGDDADSGADNGATSPEDSEFNDADVTFAQGMIPHHEQAVEMADLALTNAGSDEVRDLAEQIKAAQDPEIETMTAWLEDWDQDAPSGDMEDMDHDMEGMDGMEGMEGMMSEGEMDDLAAAEGSAFDAMFLEMMIEHHEGAVTMGEVQRADGQNTDAQDLAEEIIDTQQEEIDEMESLLEDMSS
jgi:uncharacterized protein (DUF305 family)